MRAHGHQGVAQDEHEQIKNESTQHKCRGKGWKKRGHERSNVSAKSLASLDTMSFVQAGIRCTTYEPRVALMKVKGKKSGWAATCGSGRCGVWIGARGTDRRIDRCSPLPCPAN